MELDVRKVNKPMALDDKSKIGRVGSDSAKPRSNTSSLKDRSPEPAARACASAIFDLQPEK